MELLVRWMIVVRFRIVNRFETPLVDFYCDQTGRKVDIMHTPAKTINYFSQKTHIELIKTLNVPVNVDLKGTSMRSNLPSTIINCAALYP